MADRLLRKLVVHYIAPRFPLKPTTLFITPTLLCSARCSHCTIWAEGGRSKKELTADEWRKILSDPFFDAIHTVWLSGGEPTLRKDLPLLAKSAIELLPAIESLTVATNALDPSAVALFIDSVIHAAKKADVYIHFHISLDGPPAIHDKIRGVPGAFASLEKTVAAIRAIRDKGEKIGYSFNCVIQSDNSDKLDETVAVAERLGSTITFNVADQTPGYYHSRECKPLDDDAKKKARKFVAGLIEKGDPYHRRHYETALSVLDDSPRPHRCETMEATMYLDPDSSLYLCPRAYGLENLKVSEHPPREVWRKAFAVRKRIRKEMCPTCSLGCSFGEGITFTEFAKLLLR